MRTRTGLRINRLRFDGPYADTNGLRDAEGVYVVLAAIKRDHVVIDVGHSKRIRTRLETHDRRRCWESSALGFPIVYAVCYMPHAGELHRALAEAEIREQYSPCCGEW